MKLIRQECKTGFSLAAIAPESVQHYVDVCVNIGHHFSAAAFFRIKIAIFERSKKT
jgi:hypothetical protein